MGLISSIASGINSAASALKPILPVVSAASPYVGAGLSLLGSMQSAKQSQASADRSMAFSGAQAERQMKFQDEQSRTQYQRAVADMKAAGLNPMLAAKLGGNAAMSGASGSGAMASIPDYGQAVQRGSASALATAQIDKVQVETAIKGIEKNIKLLKDLPAARVSGAKDRVVSVFVKDLDSILNAIKERSVMLTDGQFEGIRKNLQDLRNSNVVIFNEVMSGINASSRKMLETWFDLKGLFGE